MTEPTPPIEPVPPPGQPFVSPDDLSAIAPLWQQAVEDELLPIVAEVFMDTAGQIRTGLIEASGAQIPAISSLAAENYLAGAANTFDEIGNDLWETARAQLLEGFEAGESIPQLAQRLRDSSSITARTATLVARTQVLDASNAGSYATAQVSGLDLHKGWIDTSDTRTRPSHRSAGSTYGQGSEIPFAEKFKVGGYDCDRPHDPFLPAQERYNCRCTLAYTMAPAPAQAQTLEVTPAARPTPEVDLEQRARDRQAKIDRAREVADFLTEFDYLRGNEASSQALRARLARFVTKRPKPGITESGLDKLIEAYSARDTDGMRAQLQPLIIGAGLRRITGQPGTLEPFDRKRHKLIEGGTIPEGTRVWIVRPAYEADIDGEAVRLGKADVETATREEIVDYDRALAAGELGDDITAPSLPQPAIALPPPPAPLSPEVPPSVIAPQRSPEGPSVVDILDDEHISKKELESIFNATFSNGLNTKLREITRYGRDAGEDEGVVIDGTINDLTGKRVGKFSRFFGRDEQGNLYVEHSILRLEKGVQGGGFATEFNSRMYDWYRRSGVQQVRLRTAWEGGFVWARRGFDWANPDTANNMLARLERAVKALRTPDDSNMLGLFRPASKILGATDFEDQVRAAEVFIDRWKSATFGSVDYPSPFDLSELGRAAGQSGRDELWLGKWVMLDSTWQGVMWL